MPVYPPGFSERVFEFGFNSEYADQNRAVLAAAPHIPTQNEEKALGYDIAFEIKKRGGAINSIALQHKTCRFVDAKTGANQNFWNAVGGPYFAFRLDVDQFNLIESIASSGLRGVAFNYCAPLFSTRKDMDAHYLANTVLTHSVWIDPKGVGPLTDYDTHSIIIDVTGTHALVFSKEPRSISVTAPRRRPLKEGLSREKPLLVRSIYKTVYETVARFQPRYRERRHPESAFRMPAELPAIVDTQDEGEITKAIAELFSRYIGVSWLVEVRI